MIHKKRLSEYKVIYLFINNNNDYVIEEIY